ncbi:MAG: ribosome small subunit-dependent GTPase A [Arcanobacterium sp.]|nr:ribosome small subunit-dependent GTPase A [Arcanobacterium sp.]
MSRRDIGTDDPRVHVRPGRGSRPRTKIRPDYSTARRGRVTAVDRGRYAVTMIDDATAVVAVKARELPRGSVVVGDVCAMVGDLSGRKDTLARIAAVDERRTALRRTAEDGDAAGTERVIVANADQMLIVAALAQPEPKTGFIDRCLVAAYDAGLEPILVFTKADLAPSQPIVAQYAPLGLQIFATAMPVESAQEPLGIASVRAALSGHVSVFIGQSGVGKSTLINALAPEAGRATGSVNAVTGKGRHTSTSAMAFTLPSSGSSTPAPSADARGSAAPTSTPNVCHSPTVVIDTPGVRGFGLAHVCADSLLHGFPDLLDIARDCPRGCTHRAGEPECALAAVDSSALAARVQSYQRLLAAIDKPEWA